MRLAVTAMPAKPRNQANPYVAPLNWDSPLMCRADRLPMMAEMINAAAIIT